MTTQLKPPYIEHNKGIHSFVGEAATTVFAAITLASALEMYGRSGMKANRAYTPKAMIAKATEYTGKKFKARDYLGAAQAVREWAQALRATIPESTVLEKL